MGFVKPKKSEKNWFNNTYEKNYGRAGARKVQINVKSEGIRSDMIA